MEALEKLDILNRVEIFEELNILHGVEVLEEFMVEIHKRIQVFKLRAALVQGLLRFVPSIQVLLRESLATRLICRNTSSCI